MASADPIIYTNRAICAEPETAGQNSPANFSDIAGAETLSPSSNDLQIDEELLGQYHYIVPEGNC